MLNRTLLVVSIAMSALVACGPDRNTGWMDVTSSDGDATMDARVDARDAPSDIRNDLGNDVRMDAPMDRAVLDIADTGRVCAPSCTTDLQCQSSCPTPGAGSSFCCSFNVCTFMNTATCPGSATDGGGGGTCVATGCTTSAQCSTCAGGATCCFFGMCTAPFLGFCPDLGGDGGLDDGGMVTEDIPMSVDTGEVDTGTVDDAGTDADDAGSADDTAVADDAGDDAADADDASIDP